MLMTSREAHKACRTTGIIKIRFRVRASKSHRRIEADEKQSESIGGRKWLGPEVTVYHQLAETRIELSKGRRIQWHDSEGKKLGSIQSDVLHGCYRGVLC